MGAPVGKGLFEAIVVMGVAMSGCYLSHEVDEEDAAVDMRPRRLDLGPPPDFGPLPDLNLCPHECCSDPDLPECMDCGFPGCIL